MCLQLQPGDCVLVDFFDNPAHHWYYGTLVSVAAKSCKWRYEAPDGHIPEDETLQFSLFGVDGFGVRVICAATTSSPEMANITPCHLLLCS